MMSSGTFNDAKRTRTSSKYPHAASAVGTLATLVAFLKERPELQIDLEGPAGKEELVFYPDLARRWRILKLLDDDYLHSQLTHIDYEANSKSVLI